MFDKLMQLLIPTATKIKTLLHSAMKVIYRLQMFKNVKLHKKENYQQWNAL